jgi:hypothetical protein
MRQMFSLVGKVLGRLAPVHSVIRIGRSIAFDLPTDGTRVTINVEADRTQAPILDNQM